MDKGLTLEQRLERVEAFIEISNLQGRYNHYILGHHYDKILEMFSKRPDISAEMDVSGVYTGQEGVRKLFVDILGKLYNYTGNLALHQLTSPVIEIGKDGVTARAMWFSMGTNTHKDSQTGELIPIWQMGKYCHDFVKEDGEWKYLHFYWAAIFRTPFDKGWVREPVIGNIHGANEYKPIQKDPNSLYELPYDPTKDYPGYPLPPTPDK